MLVHEAQFHIQQGLNSWGRDQTDPEFGERSLWQAYMVQLSHLYEVGGWGFVRYVAVNAVSTSSKDALEVGAELWRDRETMGGRLTDHEVANMVLVAGARAEQLAGAAGNPSAELERLKTYTERLGPLGVEAVRHAVAQKDLAIAALCAGNLMSIRAVDRPIFNLDEAQWEWINHQLKTILFENPQLTRLVNSRWLERIARDRSDGQVSTLLAFVRNDRPRWWPNWALSLAACDPGSQAAVQVAADLQLLRERDHAAWMALAEIGYWRYLMRLVPRIEPPVRNAQQQWGLKFADIDAALRVPPPQKARFHLVRSHGTWAHPPSLDHIFDRVLIIRYEKSMR